MSRREGKHRGKITELVSSAAKPTFPSLLGSPRVLKEKDAVVGRFPAPSPAETGIRHIAVLTCTIGLGLESPVFAG